MNKDTTGRQILRLIRDAHSESGLPVPPIPERFVDRLHRCGNLCFSTRDIQPFRMYDFREYLLEALLGDGPDYLAFSHAGHGVNSYAFTYQLVDGPLVLMAQAPFGGVYMGERETARLLDLLERCSKLISAAAEGHAGDRWSKRLVVFESELRDINCWGWLDRSLADREEAVRWLNQHTISRESRPAPGEPPTVAALRALEDTPTPERVYPDRKSRELSEEEKLEIRHRLEAGQDVHTIAQAMGCASTQVAAVKAWMKMKG